MKFSGTDFFRPWSRQLAQGEKGAWMRERLTPTLMNPFRPFFRLGSRQISYIPSIKTNVLLSWEMGGKGAKWLREGEWRMEAESARGKERKLNAVWGLGKSGQEKTKCAETHSTEINREWERQRRKYNDDTNLELATGRERNIFSSGTLLT